MDVVIEQPSRPWQGELELPADKSIAHRAALLCAVANGVTTVSPWSSAEDCQHTLRLVEQLGVKVERLEGEAALRIHGRGWRGLQAPHGELYCGDSGTTMRLAAGLLAGQSFRSCLTAGASLARRPMRRILDPLTAMGAHCEGSQRSDSGSGQGAEGELYPPLVITGQQPLRALTYRLPVASAQVKSALLLAGLYADGPVSITEPSRSRDHTERLLKRLGVSVRGEGERLTLEPPRADAQAPQQLVLPGDLSTAAFFVVAAAISPGARLVLRGIGLNPTRAHFLEVLRRMGVSIQCDVRDEAWEPRGTVTVESGTLRATSVRAEETSRLIDELPILMVAACAAEGTTELAGLEELRVKETDRLHSITEGLRQMGARIHASGASSIRILGGPLHAAAVESFGDHRTAMSLSIAGLLATGKTRVRGAECVAKSCGSFFELLASLTGRASVRMVEPG